MMSKGINIVAPEQVICLGLDTWRFDLLRITPGDGK